MRQVTYPRIHKFTYVLCTGNTTLYSYSINISSSTSYIAYCIGAYRADRRRDAGFDPSAHAVYTPRQSTGLWTLDRQHRQCLMCPRQFENNFFCKQCTTHSSGSLRSPHRLTHRASSLKIFYLRYWCPRLFLGKHHFPFSTILSDNIFNQFILNLIKNAS